METLTTEQRMEIVCDSQSLPVGQLCRKLQYPIVTVKELETRFAVHAIAQKMNSLEEARVINSLADTYKIKSGEAIERFSVSLSQGTFRDSKKINELIAMNRDAFLRFGLPENFFVSPIKAKFCTGKVIVEPLSSYMGDDIPDRVLESLEVAKAAGLTDFYVAYPTIEVKEVEIRQEQQKDPVLLAKLGDKFLEIDMWE